jgi:hypothetical protein
LPTETGIEFGWAELGRTGNGSAAYANLMTVISLFGNRICRAAGMTSARVLDLLDLDIAQRAARPVAFHAVVVADLPGPFLDPGFIYDFGLRMPTRTELPDHIRD